MGLFKTQINPITGIALSDTTTTYVSIITGSDLNQGTIASPVATITKANVLKNIVLFRGGLIDNVTICTSAPIYLISDDNFSYLSGNIIANPYALFAYKLLVYNLTTSIYLDQNGIISNSIVKGTLTNKNYSSIINSFIDIFNPYYLGNSDNYLSNNLTIINFNNYIKGVTNKLSNAIVSSSIDLYNYSGLNNITFIPIFQNCLFRKATIWKWNGAVIPINYGTYGNTSGDYMADVISGLYTYANAMTAGTDKNYFLAMIPSSNSSNIFYVDLNGQTCKVVEDRPSVAGSHQIFNRYVNDAPVDYSLFLDKDNVALTMSNKLSYVGCYKANANVLTFGDVVNVNADGTDDLTTTPDMLIADGNGKFHVSSADSVQTRNRVRSNVFTFKRGFSLVGFQSQMKSGLGSRFSIGKFQPYNITNAPTLPQESIEVIPYDNATTPSAFPRFSAMFNDVCQVWYHTTGAKVGQPVLFNDLLSFFAIATDKNLNEYGTWVVSNADYETYLLSAKTGATLKNVTVNFAKVEINLNYYV